MFPKCNVQFDILQIVLSMCRTHILIVSSLSNPGSEPLQPMLLIVIMKVSINDMNEISPVRMLEPSPNIKFSQITWNFKCWM